MCLKQNLEAAKLCRVERQMTEEGIIFSIYTCLHLLFLHVLYLFLFAFDLTTSLGMKKNYSNCLDPFKAQFVIKLLFFGDNGLPHFREIEMFFYAFRPVKLKFNSFVLSPKIQISRIIAKITCYKHSRTFMNALFLHN